MPASILIPRKPMAGMVIEIWIYAGLQTQSVTFANHI